MLPRRLALTRLLLALASLALASATPLAAQSKGTSLSVQVAGVSLKNHGGYHAATLTIVAGSQRLYDKALSGAAQPDSDWLVPAGGDVSSQNWSSSFTVTLALRKSPASPLLTRTFIVDIRSAPSGVIPIAIDQPAESGGGTVLSGSLQYGTAEHSNVPSFSKKVVTCIFRPQ